MPYCYRLRVTYIEFKEDPEINKNLAEAETFLIIYKKPKEEQQEVIVFSWNDIFTFNSPALSAFLENVNQQGVAEIANNFYLYEYEGDITLLSDDDLSEQNPIWDSQN